MNLCAPEFLLSLLQKSKNTTDAIYFGYAICAWQAENTFLQLFLYLHDIFSAMDTLKTIRLPKHHDDLH